MELNSIEIRFVEALCECIREEYDFDGDWESDDFGEALAATHGLFLYPQEPVGIYRVDFVLTDDITNKQYAIEIDGHEAHKTKEQRFNDYRRERFLFREGYTVIRFMGSEVYTDPKLCVNELLEMIDKDHNNIVEKVNSYECAGIAIGFAKAKRFLKKGGVTEIIKGSPFFKDIKENMKRLRENMSPPDYCTFEEHLIILGVIKGNKKQ